MVKMVYYRQWEEECAKLTNCSKRGTELVSLKYTHMEPKPTLSYYISEFESAPIWLTFKQHYFFFHQECWMFPINLQINGEFLINYKI